MGSYLCDRCSKTKVQYSKAQQCHVCKKSIQNSNTQSLPLKSDIFVPLVHMGCKEKTHLNGVFVIAKYSKFVENYLGDIKYEFYFAMISDLVKLINRSLEENPHFLNVKGNSILTFVPLHKRRRNWRGFNQAEKLAQGIGAYFNIPCVKLLCRIRKTHSQVGLSRTSRLSNLKDAFELNTLKPPIKNTSNVIVVDDVMTSGATLEECAKVLKANGYQRVYGLVFARG